MSISAKEAAAAVARLDALPYAPTSAIVRAEVTKRFAELADDAAHAKRAVDWLLDGHTASKDHDERWPTPAQAREALEETRVRASRPARDCGDCKGTGWKYGERDGVTGVLRCGCSQRVVA